MAKKNKTYSPGKDIVTHLAVVAIIILLNYIHSFNFGRFDLTEDNRYTLSENTVNLLQNEDRLKDRIFFKIYLEGDLPADIMKIRNAIKEKLDEFIIYAGDNIQYEFIDPHGEEDEDYNLQVQKNIYSEGITPTDIEILESGKQEIKTIWPGALIEYKGTTSGRVQFFDKKVIYSGENLRGLADKAINNLEYLLISAVRRVTADKKKTVAFLHGHGELLPQETMDVRKGLSQYYLTEDVEINGRINALDNTDALIIAKPENRFTEKDKFVIDQFIMNGGRVLWFVDPLNVNRDSLYRTGNTFGMSANLNIEKDMIYKYGARLNNNMIVDSDCGPIFIPGHPLGVVDWYFYPLLQRADHPITKNIDPVKAEYVSTIDLVNESDKDVKKTVLLTSSYNSQIFRAPARVNYTIIDVDPNFNDEKAGNFPVAVMLEGNFTSAFENRPISDAFLNSKDYHTRFKSDSTKMLVVSDGDIIRNEVVDSAFVNGEWRYKFMPINADVYGVRKPNSTPKYAYGNKDFVLNSIDYMLDDFSLIGIRTKTITLRSLDIEKINKEKEFWKMVNIAFPLLFIGLIGGVQLVWRRRKYAKID
ncbi:MAG: gliding motility-associated ABC transporter substrate-binding protein GldG [Crocinitomicaceae bacterium]